MQRLIIFFKFLVMKKKTLNLIKLVLKYAIPAIVGWLEGDSHAIADAIGNILLLF